MTPDVSGPPQSAHPEHGRDVDLFAALWEEAPFARLPHDAPAELRNLVQDIENPKRVYAIHRASRRHNFQLLVERYVLQLRYGCERDSCATPTCFTCRKRLAGKTPVRRYNATSARTLAVYLASQDNPERGFCPFLAPAKDAPAALGSLIFSPKRPPPRPSDDVARRRSNIAPADPLRLRTTTGAANATAISPRGQKGVRSGDNRRQGRPASRNEDCVRQQRTPLDDTAPFTITERPASKDHRSFAANMFGTTAFKMLEWLTPAGLTAMSQKIVPSEKNEPPGGLDVESPGTQGNMEALAALSAVSSDLGRQVLERAELESSNIHPPAKHTSSSTSTASPISDAASDKPHVKPNARVRTTSNVNGKRDVAIEPLSPTYSSETVPPVTSPHRSGSLTEKVPRPPKATAVKPRDLPHLSPSPSFFDVDAPRHLESPRAKDVKVEVKTKHDSPTCNGAHQTRHTETNARPGPQSADKPHVHATTSPPATSDKVIPEGLLPQALTELNIEIIDLISDILQSDGTSESSLSQTCRIQPEDVEMTSQRPPLKRKAQRGTTYPKRLKKQWKLFIQQSLFSILSDPHRLISSFVKDGELLDSHALWYCMLRLTRVAPSLVFDSLWIAAGSLFGAPKSLQSLRSPTTKVFKRPERSLTNLEAGQLMAICLHGLVAAAPLVKDMRSLLYLSQLRANGLATAGSSAGSRVPTSLCLQYDDVFSDELLLRLAKRLFSAIAARQCFADMAALDENSERLSQELDGLRPLLAQLELLSIDMAPSIEFSAEERRIHEARASVLLFDWAKTVMLREWDGEPEVSCNGAFGGAVALMDAMYEKRRSLLLNDSLFRVDYFAERLDSMHMPVAWLSHESSKQRKHLLDFPYLHDPSKLVSYFRSINFLRMSRAYEDSSSLQTRMKAIVTPGGLITNSHHRTVLQDLLRTASSKFIILEISRENVVRDAFDQLWRREERELLRPLKVHLGEGAGEEGFDSGGVQQEFFRLAVAECLNPDFGAFTVDERTRMAWFVPGSLVPAWKFEILGLIMSLAVYNGLTLPITFPKAFYRKLLGESVSEIHQIADGWPDLASGLTSLLEWDETDGLVEDIFARTYEFSVSMFGQPVSRQMTSTGDEDAPAWPQATALGGRPPAADNPEDAPLVTNENREAYVGDYIRYLTDVSVRPQFEAFARGFRACLHPKSLSLLSPSLLQSVVEGEQEIDVAELRRHARYVGWDETHRSVRDFWSIVKRYDEPAKRRLLEFVTASDRVPVGGLANLQFVVQKNGEEEGDAGHLPTAYTCYGTLLLPEYRDKDVLRQRLAMALENSQGFGFA